MRLAEEAERPSTSPRVAVAASRPGRQVVRRAGYYLHARTGGGRRGEAFAALDLVHKFKPEETKPDPKPENHRRERRGGLRRAWTRPSTSWTWRSSTRSWKRPPTRCRAADEMREHAGTEFHIHPTNGVATDLARRQGQRRAPGLPQAHRLPDRPRHRRGDGQVRRRRTEDRQAHDLDPRGLHRLRAGRTARPLQGGPGRVRRDHHRLRQGAGRGRELLAQGAGFLKDADGYQQQALKGVEDDINRGKDGWDNSHVGVPDPPPRIPHGPGGHPIPY